MIKKLENNTSCLENPYIEKYTKPEIPHSFFLGEGLHSGIFEIKILIDTSVIY